METLGSRKVEYVCRKCGKIVTPKKQGTPIFCPNCGTFLKEPRPFPRYWLFQFNSRVYRWFDRVQTTQEPEQWLASHHANFMHIGDIVVIWASGNKAGIYAIGQIATEPIEEELDEEQIQFCMDKELPFKFLVNKSVMIEYIKIMTNHPILEDKCHNDKTLAGLQIFMNSQGTNFPLRYDEWERIRELSLENSGGPDRI